jgi:hypothetical protein
MEMRPHNGIRVDFLQRDNRGERRRPERAYDLLVREGCPTSIQSENMNPRSADAFLREVRVGVGEVAERLV